MDTTEVEQGKFEQEYAFRCVELFKTQTLGTGSYGAVCKAKCDQLLCAAKLLYPVLFQMQASDLGKEHRHPMKRFKQECRFLSCINHPNIIQYLGTYRDPETNAPVLLMELMDESLTHFLGSSLEDLPYHIQVNLSYDIAQALAFLHSNGIIHRDLSSNNVLLLAGRAKVADFGMSKFSKQRNTMTMCPGTAVYMSPEALNTPPVYTEKLDVFSLGVLIIQIITRKFPEPSDQLITKELVDPSFPSRKLQARIAVPEIERRDQHIGLVDIFNPLLQIAIDCLADKDKDRPTSKKLCQDLALLKELTQYLDSVHHTNSLLPTKTQQLLEQQKIIEGQKAELEMIKKQNEKNSIQMHSKKESPQVQLTKDLESKENELQAAQERLHMKNDQLLKKETELQELRARMNKQERTIQQLKELTQKMDTHVQKESHTPHTLHTPHTQATSTAAERPESTSPSNTPTLDGTPNLQRKQFIWNKALPLCPNYLKAGSAAVCGNYGYFRGAGSNMVYRFAAMERCWRTMGPHPLFGFTLVAIEDTLTSVGGFEKESSCKLFDFVDRNWIENLPEMPGGKDRPAAVYANGHLIVAGGQDTDSTPSQSVYILELDTKQWAKSSSLPFPTYHSSATICNNKIFLTTGDGIQDGNEYTVLSCSIPALLQTRRSLSLGAKLKKALQSTTRVWEAIANLPTQQSCLLSTGKEQLIAVGGIDKKRQSSKNVYKYDSSSNSWKTVATMSIGRSSCLGGIFDENLLIIVGGYKVTTKELEAITL